MENFQDRGVWIRIRIRFVLRGWIRIRIRSISDRIRNPDYYRVYLLLFSRWFLLPRLFSTLFWFFKNQVVWKQTVDRPTKWSEEDASLLIMQKTDLIVVVLTPAELAEAVEVSAAEGSHIVPTLICQLLSTEIVDNEFHSKKICNY